MTDTPTEETNHSLTIDGMPTPSLRNLGTALLVLILYGVLHTLPAIVSTILMIPSPFLGEVPFVDGLMSAASVLDNQLFADLWQVLLFAGALYYLLDLQALRVAVKNRILPVVTGFVLVIYGLELLREIPMAIAFVSRGFAPPEWHTGSLAAYVIDFFSVPSHVFRLTIVAVATVIVLSGGIQRERDYVDSLAQVALVGFALGGFRDIVTQIEFYLESHVAGEGPSFVEDVVIDVLDAGVGGAMEAFLVGVLIFGSFIATKRVLELDDDRPAQTTPVPAEVEPEP